MFSSFFQLECILLVIAEGVTFITDSFAWMNIVVVFELSKLRVESIVVDVHQKLLSILKADYDLFLFCPIKADSHIFYIASRKIVGEKSVHRNTVQIFQIY